jgi:hypothetical protein
VRFLDRINQSAHGAIARSAGDRYIARYIGINNYPSSRRKRALQERERERERVRKLIMSIMVFNEKINIYAYPKKEKIYIYIK